MKTRIATIISICGVLVAGTAAAMVNTQIFDGGPTLAGESAALLAPEPNMVDLPLVSASIDQTTPTPSTTPDVTGSPWLLTEYAVGDAGFVTLDVVNGRLRIVSVAPAPGWSIVEQEEYDGNHVEVTLSSGSTIVEFEADLVGGQIVPELEASTIASATPAPQADHDDDHDEEDHDEDDEEDEDDHDEEDHDEDDEEDEDEEDHEEEEKEDRHDD